MTKARIAKEKEEKKKKKEEKENYKEKDISLGELNKSASNQEEAVVDGGSN